MITLACKRVKTHRVCSQPQGHSHCLNPTPLIFICQPHLRKRCVCSEVSPSCLPAFFFCLLFWFLTVPTTAILTER